MVPLNYHELRIGRARRSVVTLHRRMRRDWLRQIVRHLNGRFVWHPIIQKGNQV